MEIRTRITELLAGCQSGVAIGDECAWDSSVDLQATVDDEPHATPLLLAPPDLSLSFSPQPLAFRGQPDYYGTFFSQESVGVNITLPQGVDPPVGQISQTPLVALAMSSARNPSYLSMTRTLRDRPCLVLQPDVINNSFPPFCRAANLKAK
ncbi:hypothetical protein DFH29DRAFT_1000275 [Suillus ampliporus]|nr:hypothetical protein DFH29DRAFT_1000275 [Suillus ampliporus]